MRINSEIIKSCLPYFLGKQDFTSFAKFNPDLKHYNCDVQMLTLTETEDELLIVIKANRFLHNMVRRIVGTSIRVGHHAKNPDIIKKLLAAKNASSDMIFTAPPQGLYLAEVEYEFLSKEI
jgi:tRNA pseudouridine38-40 synthase